MLTVEVLMPNSTDWPVVHCRITDPQTTERRLVARYTISRRTDSYLTEVFENLFISAELEALSPHDSLTEIL